MIITLKQVLNSVDSLKKLQEMKLPIKVSYKIKRLVNAISSELDLFNEKKNASIKEYGGEKDGNYTVKPENLETFNKEMEELLNVEITLNQEPINIEELGDITIEPYLLIDWLFTNA